MTYRRLAALTVTVMLGTGLLPAQGASPFHNTDNTPFRTRCNGPQGALLSPAPQPGLQPLAAAPLAVGQHTPANLARAEHSLRLLQSMRVKSPRAEARFPRMMYQVANGQLVLPALVTAQAAGTAIGDPTNALTFQFQGFSTADQQALQAYLQAAYPKMRLIYGPPAFNLTITIVQDATIHAVQGGIYNVSTHEIRIPPLSGNFAEDTFSLCLLVLHAFHSEAAIFYDVWEEGMAGAAATVVQTTPGVSPGYDPVDPGPFYAWSVYEAENQPGKRLVELEDDIPDEAVADHDVDHADLRVTGHDIPTLDVAHKVEIGGLFEEAVRLLGGGVTLLVFLPDVQQADLGIGPPQHILHVDRAEPRKAEQLPGRAVDGGACIEHQNREVRGGEERRDRRPFDARVESEQHRGAYQDGTGVAGGHEGIRAARLLERQSDDKTRVRLFPDCGEWLLVHADHIRGLMHLEAGAIYAGKPGQLSLDRLPAPHQLDEEARRELGQGLYRALDFGLRGVVPPHGVESDADHAQASSTSIIFLPR